MGLCFRCILIIKYISGTKPDGITLSGFFISNFKKGKPKMKKVKITNYYTQTEILERASANMVLLESQKEFREKLAALLSIHLGKVMMLDSGECTDKVSENAVMLIRMPSPISQNSEAKNQRKYLAKATFKCKAFCHHYGVIGVSPENGKVM